jgi:putative sigma-54 modulation protein
MNLKITFRHMEHTKSIDGRIREKLEKLVKKHFSLNANVDWTCLVEHDQHIASVNIVDHGHDFHAKASSDNMYKTIDQVIGKIEKQIEGQEHHPGH